MFGYGAQPPDFHVSHDAEVNQTLLAGFSSHGLAGLTAVDFLVDQLDLEQTGHITAEGLPSITPFEAGRPRHPNRLFSRPDLDVTVLTAELFVPAAFGKQLSDSILDWTERTGVEEIAILAGIPVPHGPDEHKTFYIATEDYYGRRLTDTDLPPMGNGFVDGVNGALMERGLDSPLGVGLFVTPVHAQALDIEAAIRLVETVERVYGLGIDATPLQGFANEVRQYYTELADRIQSQETELPEDRMYM